MQYLIFHEKESLLLYSSSVQASAGAGGYTIQSPFDLLAEDGSLRWGSELEARYEKLTTRGLLSH